MYMFPYAYATPRLFSNTSNNNMNTNTNTNSHNTSSSSSNNNNTSSNKYKHMCTRRPGCSGSARTAGCTGAPCRVYNRFRL